MAELFTKAEKAHAMVVNAPAVFARPDFMHWLNTHPDPVFTWHTIGEAPGEYSDVVVLVETNYEGDCSTMPEDVWRALCDLVYSVYGPTLPGISHAVAVRLTNLEE